MVVRFLGLCFQAVPWSMAVCLMVISGCSRDKRTNAISVDPARSGSELINTESKYFDGLPSISDDGSLVVFVSGRDSITGIADVRKAYKSAWSKDAAPQAVARVTAKELGNERLAKVSPDGRWVVIQAEKAGQYDLYLQDAAGKNDPVALTSDSAVEQGFSFSSDSKMLAWVTRAPNKATSVAIVVAIAGGTAAELAQQATVSATTDFVQQVFWIPAASGYSLAVGTVNPLALLSGVTLTRRSFATATAAKAATATAWLSGFSLRNDILPSATADNVLLVRTSTRDDGSQDDVTTPQVGDWVPPPLAITTVPVRSEPDYRTIEKAAPARRYSPTPGYDIAAATLTNDGKTAFMLGRFYYRCAGDQFDAFGSAFVIGAADSSKAPTLVSPRLTATEQSNRDTYINGFDFAAGGLCDRKRGDGSISRVDSNMLEMAVMRQATESNYRIIYTTPITPHFDTSCSLKAGDREVWVLDVHDGKQTFYPLSNNQAKLADSDRGYDGPCPWPLGIL